MTNATLIVFAKAPELGKVKTRLIPAVGAAAATAIYERLLNHTLQQAVLVPASLQVWYAGDREHVFWQRWPSLSYKAQIEGDLGARMAHAIACANGPVVVIGSDCLGLSASYIGQALTALAAGNDVVLGPALDGGYVLIGMQRLHSTLFEHIEWSTAQVLRQTLAAAARAELRCELLPALSDIDTHADAFRAGLLSRG